LREMHGVYTELDAAADFERYLLGQTLDNMAELNYRDRKRVHNLKYYTWVEQQGKTYKEIQEQWYQDEYWLGVQSQVEQIDVLITEFNARVGLLDL
jgi:cysteine synthase A